MGRREGVRESTVPRDTHRQTTTREQALLREWQRDRQSVRDQAGSRECG